MKKIILALCAIAFLNTSYSQNSKSYVSNDSKTFISIEKAGSTYSSEQIYTAFGNVDWCGYFFKDERHKLTLDDGALVEFKSASELSTIEENCVSEKFDDLKIYSIHDSGRILICANKSEQTKSFFKK